jgi:hypothetical protein
MGSYVLLTAFLVQRGSPESKPLDGDDRAEDQPEHAGKDSPRLARTRGLPNVLYRNSLSIVLFAFFGLSFVGHVPGRDGELQRGAGVAAGGRADLGLAVPGHAGLWFQSMQNWQSEFLAVGCLIVLGVVLRQRGSPESKPVTAPHGQTGE